MLEAYYGEFNKANSPSFAAHALDELYAWVDRLAAARPVSSYQGGASGDHACICVKNVNFFLNAYFGEECRNDNAVRFELYGPYSPEEQSQRISPFDGRGLWGSMTTACLKRLLALLDDGRSPVDYVRESALEVEVVSD